MPFPFAFAWLNAIQAVRHSHTSNMETYMKWYFNYLRIIVERKSDVKVLACANALKRAVKDLKKPSKIPKRELEDQKAEHELELAACQEKYNVT